MASDIESPTRGEPIFDQFGQFTIRYSEFFSKTSVSVNESADTIVVIDEDIDALTLRVVALELRMSAVELRMTVVEDRVTYLEGSTVVTAVDVTAEGNQVIICTDAVTVTLALAPLDKDVVEVKRTNGLVTVAGNGNTIDGSSEITLTRDFIGYSMEYSSTADAWFIL